MAGFGKRCVFELGGNRVGVFAGFAVLLAAVGIYGVLSYAVSRQTREIGIRLSLGATSARVSGEVLSKGMRLAAVGFVLGLGGSWLAARLIASRLHEVKPNDPPILIGTTLLLAAVAAAAYLAPARRASRLDPIRALRHE